MIYNLLTPNSYRPSYNYYSLIRNNHSLFCYTILLETYLITFLCPMVLYFTITNFYKFLFFALLSSIWFVFIPYLLALYIYLSFPPISFNSPVLAAAPDIKSPFARIFPVNTPILPKNPR